jgi:hypothetical protein
MLTDGLPEPNLLIDLPARERGARPRRRRPLAVTDSFRFQSI